MAAQKTKPKTKKFYFKNYRCHFMIAYHPTLKVEDILSSLPGSDAFELSNSEEAEEIEAAGMVVPYYEGRVIYLVLTGGFSLSDVSHECIHAAIAVLKMIQTTISDQTEETFAYLHSDLFEKVMLFLVNNCKISFDSLLSTLE